jgi:hypothetical protein
MSCQWNNKGEVFGAHCPFLWHTLYPYFLGLVFGAKYGEAGEIKVCCPAEFGVDTIVKMSPNDGSFSDLVPTNWRDVIYAEIIKTNGICDWGYEAGELILFPTYDKAHYRCPAIIHNMFPFMSFGIPQCINSKRIKCPDWAEEVYFELD